MDGRRILIFLETKKGCDAVTRQLRMDGWPALSIHGDKSQQERDWVLAEFKAGKHPIMIATDVAARGLGKYGRWLGTCCALAGASGALAGRQGAAACVCVCMLGGGGALACVAELASGAQSGDSQQQQATAAAWRQAQGQRQECVPISCASPAALLWARPQRGALRFAWHAMAAAAGTAATPAAVAGAAFTGWHQ